RCGHDSDLGAAGVRTALEDTAHERPATGIEQRLGPSHARRRPGRQDDAGNHRGILIQKVDRPKPAILLTFVGGSPYSDGVSSSACGRDVPGSFAHGASEDTGY